MGKIYFSGDHYIVPIALNGEDLLSMTQPLLEGLTETREHFDYIVSQIEDRPRSHPYTKFIAEHFPTSMQQHLLLLMDDLDTRISNIKDLLRTLSNYGKQPMSDPLRLHKRSPF